MECKKCKIYKDLLDSFKDTNEKILQSNYKMKNHLEQMVNLIEDLLKSSSLLV